MKKLAVVLGMMTLLIIGRTESHDFRGGPVALFREFNNETEVLDFFKTLHDKGNNGDFNIGTTSFSGTDYFGSKKIYFQGFGALTDEHARDSDEQYFEALLNVDYRTAFGYAFYFANEPNEIVSIDMFTVYNVTNVVNENIVVEEDDSRYKTILFKYDNLVLLRAWIVNKSTPGDYSFIDLELFKKEVIENFRFLI